MQKLIKKHALLNAVEHNGKAQEKAVIGKVLSEKPKLKKNIDKIRKETKKTVKQINSWSLEKQKEELKKFGKIEKPKRVERIGFLPELPKAKKERLSQDSHHFLPEHYISEI
jgi:glutamyl-tRNA synthetase